MATDTTTCSSTTVGVQKTLKPGGGAATTQVKMPIPFSLQCEKCGRRTDKGEKFWGLREKAGMDSSFDVEIYRFVFKCPCCRAQFSIKSDPGRYDYVLQGGATLIPKKF